RSLTNQDMYDIFNSRNGLLYEMIRKINFNKDQPSYHNVYMNSINSHYAVIYNGSEWTKIKSSYMFEVIIDEKYRDLKIMLDLTSEFIPDEIRSRIKATIDDLHPSNRKLRKAIIDTIK